MSCGVNLIWEIGVNSTCFYIIIRKLQSSGIFIIINNNFSSYGNDIYQSKNSNKLSFPHCVY